MGKHTSKRILSGVGQLTLVEHALCPIDARQSIGRKLNHETTFQFTNKNRKRCTGHVRVLCPLGLTPDDELLVWGLLALTLAETSSDGELYATRHYLMRHLGLIDPGSRRGGRQYTDFTLAIDRIAAVQYFNDSFYDPIRGEHVKANFGFFSYILPADVESSRAWRIVWDPVFFQYASAARGALRFDFEICRNLNAPSRRLYLFASKLLHGCQVTHPVDVRELAVNVLGYDDALSQSQLNARVRESLQRLVEFGILSRDLTRLYKRAKSRYAVVMAKGKTLRRRRSLIAIESPLLEPLGELGFEPADAGKLIERFDIRLLREWIDITMAAKEHYGLRFFKKSPAAYLRFNLNLAAEGKTGPPDWWHDMRRKSANAQAKRARKRTSTRGIDQLPEKVLVSLDEVRDAIFHQLIDAGQPKSEALKIARLVASSKPRP